MPTNSELSTEFIIERAEKEGMTHPQNSDEREAIIDAAPSKGE